MNLWAIEDDYFAQGCQVICGCDEAGAGPLAGPVYAAAVVLPRGLTILGLNDSKKLTEKRREALFDVICEHALAYAVASVDAEHIDMMNILNARLRAMDMAVGALGVTPDLTLVDGTICRYIRGNCAAIKGGDGLSANIAAASILAKVSRDRYMTAQAAIYPQYQFERHKGYGTKLHFALIEQYGLCPLHRRSFLKSYEQG